MAAVHPFAPLIERVKQSGAPLLAPVELDLRWDDPFLSVVDQAVAEVDPRVGREVKMLAQLGLVLEAERLLIEYLVVQHPSYEILSIEQSYLTCFRAENTIMHKVTTALSECSTLGTLAACLAWVGLGH